MMLTSVSVGMLPELGARYWSLGIATDDAPDFICSDYPVAVWPAAGADVGKSINIHSPNTVLSFPINRRLVAIARHEQRGPVLTVVPNGVALFNTWTLFQARQIFFAGPDFSFVMFDKRIGGKADLVEFHHRRGKGGLK